MARVYYKIGRPRNSYVLEYTNDKIKKKFEKFDNKHSFQGFQYFVLGGLGHGEYMSGFFAYQENDTLYEFFSEYKLGRVEYNSDDPNTATWVKLNGDVFPPINLIVDSRSDAASYGGRLTASQFAYDIKPHMREKRQIARMMREYFDLCHEAWLIRNKNRALEENEKNKRDTCDAEWLESLLNKR